MLNFVMLMLVIIGIFLIIGLCIDSMKTSKSNFVARKFYVASVILILITIISLIFI